MFPKNMSLVRINLSVSKQIDWRYGYVAEVLRIDIAGVCFVTFFVACLLADCLADIL